MREQRWGMEIEMTGLTREDAALILSDYFGTAYQYDGGVYSKYSVPDQQGRRWTLMSDSSIKAVDRNGDDCGIGDYSVELVTPICRYDDIPCLQEIVRRLRKAGAVSDSEHMCGLHIHVDASPFDAQKIRNLCNIMYSKEDLVYKALQVDVGRADRFCKKVDDRFINDLNKAKPRDLAAVEKIWYGGRSQRLFHYDDSRYHAVNLHSMFHKGTVEFRLFNGTLHAGLIRSYLSLALAITAQALNQTCASRRKTESSNEKYTFRTWLLRLGLVGEEFANPRKHLLEHLEGNIAWKDPAQAQRQRERNRLKCEALASAPDVLAECNIENQEEPQVEAADEERCGFRLSM